MTPAEERNREHMARVRAVHRRATYERVRRRIAYFEHLELEARTGLRSPLLAVQVEALSDLQKLLHALWQEMVDAGQVKKTTAFEL